jgi:PAS domain S-box-containing protein
LDGKLLSVNPVVASMLKYASPMELMEKVNRIGIAEALYMDPGRRQKILDRVLTHSGWLVYQERFRCKDGSTINCNFHIRAVPGEDHGSVELEGFVEDISERKRENEALRFTQFAIDKTIDQAFWMTEDARFFYVNDAACQALGYSRDELVGMSVPEIDPTFPEEVFARFWRELKEKGSMTFEVQHRAKDGRVYPVEIRANYVEFDGKEYNCAFATDISQRKAAEEALRQAALVVENSPAVLFRWRAEEGWPVEMVSRNITRFGYTPEELLSGSIPFSSLVHPEDRDRVGTELQSQIVRDEGCFQQEYRLVTKQGEERWVDERTVVERDEEGRVTHYQGIVMDITDRKRAEEALRASERKYRSIVEHAPFGITRSTREGKLVSVNPALARILKYDSPQELLETINRSSIQDVLFPEPAQRAAVVARIFAGDAWHVFDNRLLCKDGSVVTCRVHSRRILGQDGKESEFESFQENITERLAAEEALRESEEKFRVLAETSPTAICIYQGESIIYANPAMERLFGYSADELSRMKFWEWAMDEFRDLIRERGLARLRGETVPSLYEGAYLTKAGEERWVLISAGTMEYKGRPTGVASFLDITERKRAEEQIKASLAEKEVLLREIHHRVKNNLQVVSSLLYLQAQKLTDPALQACFLESQNRICSMALAHEQLYQSKNLSEVSVKAYAENLVDQLCQIFHCPDQTINCCLEVEDLELDIEKIIPCGLLITELLSNAYKHAFVDGRPGRITISIKKVGSEMGLSVADTGIGFPADIDYRHARTLGLQLVTALVNQLNGTLELDRSCGTLFRVRFAG